MVYKENEGKEFALIFSCPGRVEEKAKRPCAGVTGNNLRLLLNFANGSNGIPKSRSDLMINNAWENIEYMKKSNRTEARKAEICTSSNIERLFNELRGATTIISFGNKAKAVIDKLINEKSLILRHVNMMHLSMQSINTKIKKDVNGAMIKKGSKEATQKRIEVVVKELLNKLNGLNHA